ncbi:MAG: membrane integrity-associated transporter subunit PqiC [Desulfovibrio sp.]|jgi:cholesterol transport system auxiliary component|nr:membrane integrity-associated transporter subunit PqiC [Desulfovibrio sp.]
MRIPVTLAAILALVCAAACVKLERQPVEKRFYALEVARPAGAEAAQAPAPGVLLVRRLHVSPRLSGKELVYRTAPSVWSADYYNVYFVSPADMLTQDLRAWLASARLCSEVVDPSSLAAHQYILEGNVTSLHGDLAEKPAQAVVEMQFLLLKGGGDERAVLMTKQYRRSAPLASNSPQELVRAQREAVAAVYAALEADLRAVLPRK